MKKIIVLLMAAALAVPGQSLAGAAKMAVVNAQEQETKAVELQSEYFNMASSYEKVVYSKADHGFYLVKKGDPFYSNQQKFELFMILTAILMSRKRPFYGQKTVL